MESNNIYIPKRSYFNPLNSIALFGIDDIVSTFYYEYQRHNISHNSTAYTKKDKPSSDIPTTNKHPGTETSNKNKKENDNLNNIYISDTDSLKSIDLNEDNVITRHIETEYNNSDIGWVFVE